MADTFISSGVSSDGIVLTGEKLYVENGGEAVNTTVNEGGRMYVSSGGRANNTTLNTSGRVNVSSGGTATVTTVNSGGVVSLTGGTASGITVNESGIVYVSSGGKAAAAEFQSGGSMYVYAKGEVNTAIVNSGGFLEVSSGGTASGVEVLEGGGFRFAVAPGTCVQGTHTGSAFEMKDGRISGYTVTSGGWLHVLKGGVADNATVQSNGVVWVSSGGRLAGATLCESGRVTVSSGGIAENTLVSSGGRIQVSSGGILTGSMSIANGGSVSAYEGAILDFDLTRVSAEAPALVNDLSLVKGAPACTLTVSASQTSGTYKLANGAAGFSGTITVQNTYGDSFGTFTVGQTVYAGDSRFTLNLTDGTLSVTVNGPTVTDESGDVLLANAMPQAEYMYGCCPTAVAMLLGYYDLYGYRGKDFSSLIEGDVALESRGTDGDKYNMNAFDTVLGRATATEDYVYRFFSRTDIGDIVADIDAAVPTTPEEELEYSFVNGGEGPDLRTDIWNCLADYLGTGQIWRGNDNLSTGYRDNMLEQVLNDEDTLTIVSGDIARTIETRYEDFLYGLYLYVQSRDYAMDMKVTATNFVDVNGGDFTFEDYKKEIDAGRPVLIMIEEHVMTGYGYNAGTKEIIFDDCYESGQRMVWDGVYNYAGEDRRLEAVATIGFMATDADIDLAVAAIDGAAEKLIFSTEEDSLVSADYIFAGSPLYLSFAAANLGKSPSGSFDAGISIDDEQKERVSPISLSGESVMNLRNIPIAAELGVGLHSFVIALDPDAAIQEQAARNNVEQRSLMVLKEGTNVVNGTKTVASGEVSSDDYVMNGAGIIVQDGGTADGTIIQGKVTNRAANGEVTFVPGIVNVAQGGLVRDAEVYEYGQLQVSGTAENILVYENGYAAVFDGGTVSGISVDETATLLVESGGVLTGLIQLDQDAEVSFEDGAVLNFDLTQTKAGGEALVNDLSVIKGTPTFTLTVSGSQKSGTYTLAEGASGFTGTITVKNTLGESLGALAAGETVTINGKDYLLTNENSVLSVTVANNADAPAPKWTYLVYMAADSNLSRSALYDIISMQQAECNPQIDIYVLADRAPAGTEGSGDYETINGTYRWDSDWEDTRVGKLTSSPGLTVTVDWESWGELDTGSIETLERFVNWVQEESPADNYGLILWDHGREDAEFCWDLTTDPDWGACIRVSEVSDLLKKKGNIPIVIFNACLFSSELVVTQMAGSTDVIVVSEPTSYGETITYNYNMFFRTITPDMTPQEMAAIMVRNVGPQYNYPGDPTMLTSIDVTGSRLAETLDALAEAVAAADNDADKVVLIQAMLKAPQNGSNYDGSSVQQSDLGFIIRDVMADPDYESTSEEFKKALADVKTALESIVLEYRSMPANRGSGIAVFNPVYTAMVYLNNGLTPEAIGMSIHSYLNSCYESNLLWAALLDYLGATYLEEVEAGLVPTSVFSVSDVDGLVDGRTVSVSDIGCFSGRGERFDCIRLHDEMFFGFVITADDKSTGSFTVSNDADAAVTVSLLAADGTVVETGTGSVSFQNLSAGSYYLRLQSETDCGVTLSSEADWWTGVDRFDYAGSGQNEKHVNGNGSPETATALATGLYSGLITCQGDTDCYLIADTNAPLYIVEVYGEEGWTVCEYDAEEGILHKADCSDGKYTLIMEPGSYFLVEGTADLANGSDLYSLNVIAKYLPVDVTLDHLAGTQDGVSWEPSVLMDAYTVECSMDGFDHALQFVTTGTAVDLLNLPVGTYQWRVTTDSGEEDPEWYDGEEIVSDNTTAAPKVFRSNSDSNDDIFFATPADTWNSRYYAKHFGSVGDWNGTGEMVSAAGKGRIQDMFFGSADPGSLFLTDSENGDALFLDDIYTGLPEEIEENTARLFRVRGIFAGAGDDIVDMTSQRFQYIGGNLLISGGDGDDVIWANRGARNSLFGDAGNDRIVGASGDDVIAGGIGDDRLHGGGGDDIFTFCENWGTDTVEQLETGTVTLWFLSGSMENWNAETLTYSDGENSVTVSGVSADQVTLKFELGKSSLFGQLYNMGAFSESLTKKIFDDTDKGYLASL